MTPESLTSLLGLPCFHISSIICSGFGGGGGEGIGDSAGGGNDGCGGGRGDVQKLHVLHAQNGQCVGAKLEEQ